MSHWNTRTSARTPATLLLAAMLMLLVAAPAHGQLKHEGPEKAIALAATLPSYDVVSVKQHDSSQESPNEQSANMSIHDNVFTASNMPLQNIIEFAYDIKGDLISGITGTVSSGRFDIEAKVLAGDGGVPPKLTDTQLEAMIIPLLADRFHLKLHLQPKILPVYELVVERGGPKFKLSTEERKDNSVNMNTSNNDKILTAKGSSMGDLALALSDDVHRLVVDKTGLAGTADITLKWTTDEAADQGVPIVSIFTAVQEQLGLKLQSAKGPVQTIVIDHAEMPSKN